MAQFFWKHRPNPTFRADFKSIEACALATRHLCQNLVPQIWGLPNSQGPITTNDIALNVWWTLKMIMRIGSKLRFCYWIEVSSKAIKMRNDFSLIFFFPITSVLVLYTGILFGVTLELVHEGTFLFVRSRKCQKHRVVIRLHATCRFHRYEVTCIHPRIVPHKKWPVARILRVHDPCITEISVVGLIF